MSMSDKNVYRVCVKTSTGNLYYLSDNNMSTPGVGPEGTSNLDSFTYDEENFAFLSNCTPEDVYHFSTEEKAKEAIDNLPFPYKERSQPIEVPTVKTPLYKKIYYRIGKIHCPVGVSWLNLDGSFTTSIPKESKTLFTDKTEAEKYLSDFKNVPIGTSVFEFYDFGEPDFIFWYRVNSGAVFSHDTKLKVQRKDVDIEQCVFGDLENVKYVFYRFYIKTSDGIKWLRKNNTFEPGVDEDTIAFYTLNDAKKYAEQNSFDFSVKIIEIYSSGDPDWKWNYKVLSTGKVYTPEAVEITS